MTEATSAPLAPPDDPRVAEIRECVKRVRAYIERIIAEGLPDPIPGKKQVFGVHAYRRDWFEDLEFLLADGDALAARTAELERENAELYGEVAAYRETRTAEVIADLQAQLAAAREDSTLIDALATAMAEHTPPPGSVVGRGQLVIGIDHWADHGKFDVGIAGAHAEDHETIANALRGALRQLTDRHEETRNA